MCGIAGVRKFGKTPITGEELVILLCSLEHRGKDATGIALMNPDGIHVHKAPLPAWAFTKSQEFIDFLETHLKETTTVALLHTRWATVGSPEDNENNHPVFDGETAVVHNGGISNHTQVFFNEKLKRSCETDSDIFRALLSKYGFNEKAIREMCKLSGSAAIACVSTNEKDKLLIARSGSPLHYGWTPDGDKLYWASTAQALVTASRPFRQIRGVWVQDTKSNLEIGSMPDNSAWLFDNEGLVFHQKFDVCFHYNAPDYSHGTENYHSKTRRFKREKRRKEKDAKREVVTLTSPDKVPVGPSWDRKLIGAAVSCPNKKCGKLLTNKSGRIWKELECPVCKTPLA